jgi:hypothetical protein
VLAILIIKDIHNLTDFARIDKSHQFINVQAFYLG